MTFKRKLWGLAAVSLVVLAIPASASAVTLGETFVPNDNCSPKTRLQSASPGGQYAAPFDGVITSWSHLASASGSAPVEFKVGRHVSGDDFKIVGEDAGGVPTPGVFHTYAAQIAVEAGDVIGLYAAPASVYYCRRAASGYIQHETPTFTDVPAGATATFTAVADRQLDVSAVLERDCDGDGLGDETQDTDTSTCPRCHGQLATIAGTPGDDSLTGTNGDDAIVGLAGDDEIGAAGGEDCLSGDAGNDVLRGGAGHDLALGGDGKDKLRGQNGRDTLRGDAGRDKVNGGNGKDKLKGGPGKDKLKGAGAKDKIKGNAGADRVGAQDGKKDRVNCGGGNDRAVVDPIDKVKNCETVKVVDAD